jgi:hypothetical protein
MQLVPRYILKNRITVVVNSTPFNVEYAPVYQRQIIAHRGIDNIIQFKMINADQKPVSGFGKVPKFKAFDKDGTLVLEKTLEPRDDGSSNATGLVDLIITENDLLNIESQFLSYVFYVDSENLHEPSVLTYSNTNFKADGVIKIENSAFPIAAPSKVITEFFQGGALQNPNYYTSMIYADPTLNGNEALHTVVFYSDGYTGEITIQGTMDISTSPTISWSDIKVVSFNGEEDQPVSTNFNGVYSFIRFFSVEDPREKITRILVRN